MHGHVDATRNVGRCHPLRFISASATHGWQVVVSRSVCERSRRRRVELHCTRLFAVDVKMS